MRFRGKHPPQTAAQRQAKCALSSGASGIPLRACRSRCLRGCRFREIRICCPTSWRNSRGSRPGAGKRRCPSWSACPCASSIAARRCPHCAATAIQKSFSSDSRSLALLGGEESDGGPRLCLPAGVAARLRSLLDKHQAGKTLTAAERAEAEGLLDIAEYFAVQRLRQRFAA